MNYASRSHHAMNRRIIETVEQTISEYGMLLPGDAVLVGVSGGPDSLALAHILLTMAPRFELTLGIAHVNHCLRGADSDEDAAFVSRTAEGLGLPFYTVSSDARFDMKESRTSLEAAARRTRYRFFSRIAEENGYSKIATGHHLDDNAEQVLMDLFRGSGRRGFAGIPPIRSNRIIRPLINLTRLEILRYLRENEMPFRQDASNSDLRFMRNRIRHKLIPLLKAAYNPNIAETLNRLTYIFRAEEEWIAQSIDPIYRRVASESASRNQIHLSAALMASLHQAAKRRIIRKGIERLKGDLNRIRLSHIEKALGLLSAGISYRSIDLPDRIRISFMHGSLRLGIERVPLRDAQSPRHLNASDSRPEFSYQLDKPGSLSIPEINGKLVLTVLPPFKAPESIPAGQDIAFIDMGRLEFPITVRNVKPGDRFIPLGMSSFQKVNRFFIKQKISRDDRCRSPLVLDNRQRVIWIAGHRIDNRVRVTSESRRLLKGELFLA